MDSLKRAGKSNDELHAALRCTPRDELPALPGHEGASEEETEPGMIRLGRVSGGEQFVPIVRGEPGSIV